MVECHFYMVEDDFSMVGNDYIMVECHIYKDEDDFSIVGNDFSMVVNDYIVVG